MLAERATEASGGVPAKVFWIIWISFLGALAGIPAGLTAIGLAGAASDLLPLPAVSALLFSLVALASVIRWVLLPKVPFRLRIVPFLFGLALSESVLFGALFLFPAEVGELRVVFLTLALLSVAQFVPFFAHPQARLERAS